MTYYEAMVGVERDIRNAARRATRRGEADKAAAYQYAAWLLRRALKDLRGSAT